MSKPMFVGDAEEWRKEFVLANKVDGTTREDYMIAMQNDPVLYALWNLWTKHTGITFEQICIRGCIMLSEQCRRLEKELAERISNE